ncbi:unnamed protein product [Pleuronectes platessa]|uniref:Uncharacterized protein n=1 Tax=Pleuronectes platessa TaxID=8262 RepID=A0A9N7UI04_PLEPL|nr:unnamed protein product [Pleuronectes platessa]
MSTVISPLINRVSPSPVVRRSCRGEPVSAARSLRRKCVNTRANNRGTMGERFVVVPVDGGAAVVGDREPSDAVVSDPAPDTGGSAGGGRAAAEEIEEGEDSVFEPQDPNTVVPILEYNREPNKYGKTLRPRPTTYLLCLSED